MAQALFIGVDGGGTNCRARLRDDAGRLLGEGSGGPANARLGERAFAEVLRPAARRWQRPGSAKATSPASMPGSGSPAGPAGRPRLHAGAAAPLRLAGRRHRRLCRLARRLRRRDGAILIVGTGTAGLAVVEGKRINVGGWGDRDRRRGRAAWRSAATAIRRSIWALEGMAPLTPFAEEVLDRFERRPDAAVTWAESAKPADFARFAPLVFDHAEQARPAGGRDHREAAGDAARMIKRLLEVGAPAVAPIGGVFPSVGGGCRRRLPPSRRAGGRRDRWRHPHGAAGASARRGHRLMLLETTAPTTLAASTRRARRRSISSFSG